jgi:hypothetical protein
MQTSDGKRDPMSPPSPHSPSSASPMTHGDVLGHDRDDDDG